MAEAKMSGASSKIEDHSSSFMITVEQPILCDLYHDGRLAKAIFLSWVSYGLVRRIPIRNHS